MRKNDWSEKNCLFPDSVFYCCKISSLSNDWDYYGYNKTDNCKKTSKEYGFSISTDTCLYKKNSTNGYLVYSNVSNGYIPFYNWKVICFNADITFYYTHSFRYYFNQ